LTTIYKVNTNKRNNTTFIGSDGFHYRYEDQEENKGNNWNNNLMPGLEARITRLLINIHKISSFTLLLSIIYWSTTVPVVIKTSSEERWSLRGEGWELYI